MYFFQFIWNPNIKISSLSKKSVEQKDPSPKRRGQRTSPTTRDRRCRHQSNFLLALVVSVPFALITDLTKDSICIHMSSDWSMRGIIVSWVSCAPTTRQSSGTGTISCPWPAKPRSFQGSFSGIWYPTNDWPATGFLQQVGVCAINRHTWRSRRLDPPVTLEGCHMSSLL